MLAYLAAVTRRVMLGTSVYLLPLRNPLLAAKQAVSLDRLSEDAWCSGWASAGWRASSRRSGCPTGSAAAGPTRRSRCSRHCAVQDSAEFLPKPVQRPHPPLWIGGRSDAAVRRAARAGDAWHPSHLTVDELRRQIPQLHEECERAGRSAGRGDGDDAPQARARIAHRRRGDRVLQGDAGAIAATVAELEQVGVSHLIVEIPGSSEGELLENLDWFGREVLAEIRHA